MARTVLVPNQVSRAGSTAPTEQAGDTVNNHVVANTGRTVIIVRNADSAGPHNVTVHILKTEDGQAVTPRTIAIPASTTVHIGQFGPDLYGAQLQVDVDSTQLKLIAVEP